MSKQFTYTLKIDAEIQDLLAKTRQVQSSVQSMMDAGKMPGAKKMFDGITRAIDDLQKRASVPITSEATFGALTRDLADAKLQIRRLGDAIEDVRALSEQDRLELVPPGLKSQIDSAIASLDKFGKAQAAAAQETQDLIDAEKQLADAQKKLQEIEKKRDTKQSQVDTQRTVVDLAKAEAQATRDKIDALKKYQATLAKYEQEGWDKRSKHKQGGQEYSLSADRIAAKSAGMDISTPQALEQAIQSLSQTLSDQSKIVTQTKSTLASYEGQLRTAEGQVSTAKTSVDNLKASAQNLRTAFDAKKLQQTDAAFAELRKEADALGVDLRGIPVNYTDQAFKDLTDRLMVFKTQGLDTVEQGCQAAENQLVDLETAVRGTNDALDAHYETFKNGSKITADIDAMSMRIKQFVGLQGAALIARKALKSAIESIRELDAVMTEMAVVTDLEIGDYWDQLPEHTARANELGTAIANVYKAETLYYQQGLKTNEVIGMSTKTLQMARVAGLSAEDATNKMTAALRGFNMELNETSAQRVADVYSELAAITASDVNEISSAMTKTASIAASAGMEFETTAAFLSQIIETTRESAETAGTAMKTVIARFQELKKDPSEIGEVEGEIVDANAIETALRSVGVSLRDASGQFRELDDVFLELSSKWDSLDKNTQRYIATIAAGSRQQSRFIAMMSDYGRTQELVTAANNSAGASAEQYEKTLESFESKVQQLQNAWKSFSMGLANSDLIKGAITVLTKIVTILDKMTSGVDGLANSLSKISLIFVVVKTGKTLLQKFGETIKKFFMKLGREAGKGFRDSMTSSLQPDRAPDPNDPAAKWAKPDKSTKGRLGALWDKTGFGTGYHFAKEAGEAQKQVDDAEFQIWRQQIIIEDNTEEVKQKFESFKNDFVSKFKALGGSCDQAEKAWESYVDSITAGGDEAATAISCMDQELEDLAKELQKTDPSATIDPTNLKVAQASYDDYANTAKRAEKENAEATKNMAAAQQVFAEKTEEANFKAAAATDAFASACDKTGMALVAIGAAATFVGTQLENMGIEGMEETMSKLSTVLTSVGGGISGVSSLMKSLGVSFKGGMVSIGKTTMSLKQFGIWALIITAAIVALTLAINYFSNNTAKGKARRALESAEDAAKSASEAADEAKESFEGLFKSLESLESRYDGLEKMVKGTEEWKKAVKETNAEVLALIDEYPELASLFEKNADGILSVKEGGEEKMNEILADKERTANALKAAEVAAKARISQAKTDYGFANLSNKSDAGFVDEHVWGATIAAGATGAALGAKGGTVAGGAIGSAAGGIGAAPGAVIGGIAGGVIGGSAAAVGAHAAAEAIAKDFRENSQEYTEKMAKAFADGDLSKDATAEEIAAKAQQFGVDESLAKAWGKQLEGNTEELANFGTAVLAAEAEMDAYNTQMAMLAAEAVNTSGMTDAQKNIINTATNGDFIEQMVENANTALAKETKGMGKKEYKEWAKQQAMQLYGTEDITVDNKGNVTVGTGDEAKTYTREQFESQLTAAQASEEMTKALQNLPHEIEKASRSFGGEAGKAFKKVFEKSEGKGLTQSEIDALSKTSDADLEKAYKDSPALQAMYGSVEEYTNAIRESTRMASDRFDLAFGKLQSYGIDTKDLGTKLTSEAAEGFASGMNIVYAQSGEEGVKTINAMVSAMTEGLNDDEVQSFYSALSGLDWSSIQSLDTFGTVLETLGVEIPTSELKGFVDELKGAAGAINKISFDAVMDQAKAIASVMRMLKEGKYQISQEEFDKLSPGTQQFYQQTGEGYQFYGNEEDFFRIASEAVAASGQDYLTEIARGVMKEDANKTITTRKEQSVVYSHLNTLDTARTFPDRHTTELKINYIDSIIDSATALDLRLRDREGNTDTAAYEALFQRLLEHDSTVLEELGYENSEYLWQVIEDYRGPGEVAVPGTSIGLPYTFDLKGAMEYDAPANKTAPDPVKVKAAMLWQYVVQARSLGFPTQEFHDSLGDKITREEDLYSWSSEELDKALSGVEEQIINGKIDEYATSKYADLLAQMGASSIVGAISDTNVYTQSAGRMALQQTARTSGLNVQANRYAEINDLLEEGKLSEEEYNSLLAERNDLEQQMIFGSQLLTYNEKLAETFDGLTDAVKNYYKAGTEAEKLAWAQVLGNKFGIGVNKENEQQFMKLLKGVVNNPTSVNTIGRLFGLEYGDSTAKRIFQGKELWQRDMDAANELVEKGFGVLQTYTDEAGNQITKFVPNLAKIGDAAREAAEGLESAYNKINSLQYNSDAYLRRRERNKANYDRAIEGGKDYSTISGLYEQQKANLNASNKTLSADLYNMGMDLSTKITTNNLGKYMSYDFNQKDILFTDEWFALSEEERAAYESILEDINSDLSNIQNFDSQIVQNTEDLDELDKELAAAETEMTEKARQLLIDERQEQIDALSSINDSINEAQEKLVSKMQEQIDDARQARDNERTERELADKETRLAYLRANSAGNELEILQLEKELAEEQESYTDSLVDQAIDRLTDANAEAAEQRERQISIMEEQLKAYEESAESWMEAQTLVAAAALEMAGGAKFEDTEFGKKLYASEIKSGNMNPTEVEEYMNSMTGSMGQAATNIINALNQEAVWAEQGKYVSGSSRSGLLANYYVTETTWGEFVPTLKKYKTGGLADFTGPAWLDGTPSRPELVLNQRDTANFIVLKDILSDILSGTSGLSKHGEQEGGDNYFDIDINVESLGDDYDVDQVADRIRDLIYEDSMYRNVTAVNTLR